MLVVDDELINRELLSAILSPRYEVVQAENGAEAWELLTTSEQPFSLVMLDLFMPVMSGFELLEKRRESEEARAVPVIVMTSDKSAEVKSIRMGAADFISKPYHLPDVILARCERIIELNEDKSIIRYTERDALTELYSKEYFSEYIRRLRPDLKGDVDAAVLYIEHFGMLNELFGRAEGDRILRETAGLITRIIISSSGIACRTDGNSFRIYRRHCDNWEELVERVQTELSSLSPSKGLRLRAGVYQSVDPELDTESCFDRAKAACDRIKGNYGRNTEFYNRELHELEMHRQRLIGDIDEAIENGDLRVFYQPKYRISGERPVLCSAEALVRWQHPRLGMISPGEFIPLFEKNGLIGKIDGCVWREAAAQVGKWKEKYGFTLPVSVNVSRVDIFDHSLECKLCSLLESFGLKPGDLMLEITESAYSDNAERLISLVGSLRSCGFPIEMDDFSSGYSSLNMLTTIPIDILKLDMSFIRSMMLDKKSLRLVELILDIAKFLGVPTVAEGVETEEQLLTLKKMGCEIIQGYYFSPPVPAERFSEFIEKEIMQST